MASLRLLAARCGLLLAPTATLAQQASDVVSWTAAGLRWQSDSGRWALEGSFNYLRYEQLSRPFVQVGLGQLSYRLARPQLTLTATYIAGSVAGQGTVQLPQMHVGGQLARGPSHAHWQFTLDCLRLTPALYQGRERAPIYRVRTLVGIEPALTPRLRGLLTAEPFLYRSGWLREVRSQVGLRWQPAPWAQVQAVYWNWWAGYEPRRVRWQHTLLLTATLALGRGGHHF